MDEFTQEVRVVLARYGPLLEREVAMLLGSEYLDNYDALHDLKEAGQARELSGLKGYELTREGHLAVAPVKRWMEVPW